MSEDELKSLIKTALRTKPLCDSDPECSPEVWVHPLAAELALELQKLMGASPSHLSIPIRVKRVECFDNLPHFTLEVGDEVHPTEENMWGSYFFPDGFDVGGTKCVRNIVINLDEYGRVKNVN